VLLSAAAFALLVGTAGLGRWRLAAGPEDSSALVKEVLLLPPARVLKKIDLGYHALAADLLFIRANLYYGKHLLSDEQLPWLDSFVDNLLELDPDFKGAYLWSATTTVYRERTNTYANDEHVRRANQILARGMTRFPEDHRFPLRIGFNLYYELGDTQKATPYFERASSLPDAPAWLREKLIDLYTKEGRRELAGRVLNQIISESDDPTLAEALRSRMDVLLSRRDRERLEAAHEQLMAEWRDAYDFLPLDLYLVIREP